jgi:uncharacterized protein
MTLFDQLTEQKYLNIETFRKNGVGVKTPVWFVKEGDTLFIRTGDNSGKVKRIRNNEKVNIAPCKMDGAVLGKWFPAKANELKDDDTNLKVDRLLDKKYGLMKKIFGLASTLQGTKYTILKLTVGKEA